jgi:hypothetical protein
MHNLNVPESDRWLKAGRQALVSGTLASLFSTAALAWLGYRRYGKPAAPTNATSHWLWGDDDAFLASEPDVRHTGVGYATHHASACMWALLCERWLERKEHPTVGEIVGTAAATTAVAAFVDYVLTPKRLRPGFEAHLPPAELAGVFAAFGVGLAAGGVINRQHERRLRRTLTLPADYELPGVDASNEDSAAAYDLDESSHLSPDSWSTSAADDAVQDRRSPMRSNASNATAPTAER